MSRGSSGSRPGSFIYRADQLLKQFEIQLRKAKLDVDYNAVDIFRWINDERRKLKRGTR